VIESVPLGAGGITNHNPDLDTDRNWLTEILPPASALRILAAESAPYVPTRGPSVWSSPPVLTPAVRSAPPPRPTLPMSVPGAGPGLASRIFDIGRWRHRTAVAPSGIRCPLDIAFRCAPTSRIHRMDIAPAAPLPLLRPHAPAPAAGLGARTWLPLCAPAPSVASSARVAFSNSPRSRSISRFSHSFLSQAAVLPLDHLRCWFRGLF